jgi:hypothetical protein
MPRWEPKRLRKRAVSRIVPEPITRAGSRPERRVATSVMMSTGFVATRRIASGAAARTLPTTVAEDGGVAGEELEPRLPGLLRDAGREDDDGGALQVVVIARR